jgi:putative alpha-1,2-mannosidase
VWASLGLFPVAGQNLFLINAPAFAHSTIRVPEGEFVVEAVGHRDQPIGADGLGYQPPVQYVQSATLDGEWLDAAHLSALQLHRGGRLQLDLGPEPSDWGQKLRPPSASDPATTARMVRR